jgi:rubrerythrin
MRAETTTMGLNRTGIGTSPLDSADVIRSAEEAARTIESDGIGLARVREAYESDAEPVGSVPIPTSLKGALKTAVMLVKGKRPAVLLDRLGERLAFERTGTRLYEALLAKHATSAGWNGGPSREELERFHADELDHFELLSDCIEELGGDPTAETPAADVAGVLASGVLLVATDPRTTLAQSLNALLTAELTDNDGWQILLDLVRALRHDELAARFLRAQQQELIHLGWVRRWVSSACAVLAKVEDPEA